MLEFAKTASIPPVRLLYGERGDRRGETQGVEVVQTKLWPIYIEPAQLGFTDAAGIPAWARAGVGISFTKGVLNRLPGRFLPR